jgi:hypothetical protein
MAPITVKTKKFFFNHGFLKVDKMSDGTYRMYICPAIRHGISNDLRLAIPRLCDFLGLDHRPFGYNTFWPKI